MTRVLASKRPPSALSLGKTRSLRQTASRYFVDSGSDVVRRAKMGMNSLPKRQPPLLTGGLRRREKRLSTVFAWRFGDAFELSGRLITGINKVPLVGCTPHTQEHGAPGERGLGRRTRRVRRVSGVHAHVLPLAVPSAPGATHGAPHRAMVLCAGPPWSPPKIKGGTTGPLSRAKRATLACAVDQGH